MEYIDLKPKLEYGFKIKYGVRIENRNWDMDFKTKYGIWI
jgi:hypothetical protein